MALAWAATGAVVVAAPAQAAEVDKIEPNNSISEAQSLDGWFDTSADPDIGRLVPGATTDTGTWVDTSTTVPHATVDAQGDGTVDFYRFTVPAEAATTTYVVMLDVDHGEPAGASDTVLRLYDPEGNVVVTGDDTHPYDPGSTYPFWGVTWSRDAYVQYADPVPGEYTVRVSTRYPADPIRTWETYQLHVSVGPRGEDTTAPQVYLPDGMTWEADNPDGISAVPVYVPEPTARDDWYGSVPVRCTPAVGSAFPLGTTEVLCAASDGVGNTTTGSFGIKVQDTRAPTISLPPEVPVDDGTIAVMATGPEGAVVTWTAPTATDLVDGDVAVASDHASGELFPIGDTDVQLTATDSRGNTAETLFTVAVVEPAPVLTLPEDVTVEATGPAGAVVTFAASATDDWDGDLPVTCEPASGSTFPIGSTQVQCSATDSYGATTVQVFTVAVTADTTPPTVTLAATPAATTTATVTATFSERVQGVTTTTFYLKKKNTVVPASVTNPSQDGRTWVLDPTKDLAKGSTYTATVTAGVTDLSGNQLANAPVTWSFTVAKR